jgi:hypothetical protein
MHRMVGDFFMCVTTCISHGLRPLLPVGAIEPGRRLARCLPGQQKLLFDGGDDGASRAESGAVRDPPIQPGGATGSGSTVSQGAVRVIAVLTMEVPRAGARGDSFTAHVTLRSPHTTRSHQLLSGLGSGQRTHSSVCVVRWSRRSFTSDDPCLRYRTAVHLPITRRARHGDGHGCLCISEISTHIGRVPALPLGNDKVTSMGSL